MSWKSCATAMLATTLVAAAIGCGDDDPSRPDPEPITLTGAYQYEFDLASEQGESTCTGNGTINISQESETAFTAQTGTDAVVECLGEPEQPSGEITLAGEISGNDVSFEFPLLADTELCIAEGEVQSDPVTGILGSATCEVNPEALGLQPGDPVLLTGTWQAVRMGG